MNVLYHLLSIYKYTFIILCIEYYVSAYKPNLLKFPTQQQTLGRPVWQSSADLCCTWFIPLSYYCRFFSGTHESTFSFRIQEEREIMGFPPDRTFNRLCGDDEQKCSQPSAWRIVFW